MTHSIWHSLLLLSAYVLCLGLCAVILIVTYAVFLNIWYSRLGNHGAWPKHVDEFFWRAGDAHNLLWAGKQVRYW